MISVYKSSLKKKPWNFGKALSSNLTRNLPLSFLLGIFLATRLVLIPINADWQDDAARDQIMANLILKNKEFVKIGHWNSGLNLNYPPYYYYLMASIISLNNSYEWVLVVLTLLNLAAGLSLYRLAKLLGCKKIAIFACFLFLISPPMIMANSTAWSAYVVVPLAMITLYFAIKTILEKEVNRFQLLLIIIIVNLLTTIQYGAVVLLPIIIGAVLLFSKSNWQKLLYPIITFLSLFAVNLPIINKYGFKTYIQSHVQLFLSNSLYQYDYSTVLKNVKEVFLTPNLDPSKLYLLDETIFLVLILFLFWVFLAKNNKLKLFITFLFFYFIAVIILLAKMGIYHYGMSIYPLLFVLITVFTDSLLKNKLILFKTVGLLASAYLIYVTFPLTQLKYLSQQGSGYSQNKQFFDSVSNNNKGEKILILSLSKQQEGPDYLQSLNFWYFDAIEHINRYSSQLEAFCPAVKERICFRGIPDKILLVCPRGGSVTTQFLETVDKDLCASEFERISSMVGINYSNRSVKIQELNSIIVNKNKYINLSEPLFPY